METSDISLLTEERTVVRTGATVEEYMIFEDTTEVRHESKLLLY
jgi:hypothetical protein